MALTDKLKNIADAIRSKTNSTDGMTLDQMPGKIMGITTSDGGITLPELENPASETDIASGKQLIGPDGSIVTGTLAETTEGTKVFANGNYGVEGTPGNTTIVPYGTFDTNNIGDNTRGFIARPGTVFHLRTFPTSLLGNARADQVMKGASFTSEAGYLVEGTHECESGVNLPTLNNPASATDMASGKQLIGPDGTIITGALGESGAGIKVFTNGGITISGTPGDTTFHPYGIYDSDNVGDNTRGFIMRPGTEMVVRNVPTSLLGNARADQVMKGASFTSEAGYLVEGTMEAGGGSSDFGENTVVPNPLNMFYALEKGTGVTGEFTLASLLPNTETLIFDTGLSEIKGIIYIDADFAYGQTTYTGGQVGTSGIMLRENGVAVLELFLNNSVKSSTDLRPNPNIGFVSQGKYRIDGGTLYVTANYNNNATYTPFAAKHRYKWFAW